jgi:CBS domain-containing protein
MPLDTVYKSRAQESVKDLPRGVDHETTVIDAVKLMHKTGSTQLAVTRRADGLLLTLGTITARDIRTRVITPGLDPNVLTMGDIVWPDMPSDLDADTAN